MAKKKRVMSEAQKAAMKAGRERAAKAKAAAQPTVNDVDAALSEQPTPDAAENVSQILDDNDTVLTNPNIVDLPPDAHPAPLPQAERTEQQAPAEYTPNMADLESNPLYPMLMKMQAQMDELQKANQHLTTDQRINAVGQLDGVSVGNNGVVGQKIKYPIDNGYYPNPVDDLYNDETLRRFALRENFYISWDVTGAEYEKGNVLFAEPRFEVAVYRYMYDEEGMPNGKMYLVGRIFLHEDEMLARVAAQRMGLVAGKDYEDIRDLLNKIRMIRIQKWLRESFRPVSVKGYAKKSTTMVIDGKQVEVFDTEDVVEKAKAEEQAALIKAQTARSNNIGI